MSENEIDYDSPIKKILSDNAAIVENKKGVEYIYFKKMPSLDEINTIRELTLRHPNSNNFSSMLMFDELKGDKNG